MKHWGMAAILAFGLAVCSSTSAAAFENDTDVRALIRVFGLSTVGDLIVGDRARLLNGPWMCSQAGEFVLPFDTPLAPAGTTDPAIVVTVIPGQQVAIDTTQISVESTYGLWSWFFPDCDYWKDTGAIASDKVFKIQSIDGKTSMSEWLKTLVPRIKKKSN